jgi:hypothetical protein
MLAEVDLVQIIIIVIAMIGGFIQWLWNVIQQAKADAARRRQRPLTPEEKALREEAWRRQVEGGAPPRPTPTATPPPVNDPFATVRELFEQVKREAAKLPQPQPEAQPPPLRPASAAKKAKRGSVRSDMPAAQPVPQDAARGSVAADLARPAFAPAPPPQPATPAVPPTPWAALLGTPAALRQAIVLREILGPPKALQSAEGSAA